MNDLDAWQKYREARQWSDRELLPKLRQARLREYVEWLRGFVAAGGKPTHHYDYPFPQGSFYVARASFGFEHPLCGAASVQVLLPPEVLFEGGPLGHCTLFFQDDYSVLGTWVPTYQDARP